MMSRDLMQALVFDHPAPDSSATRIEAINVPIPGVGQVSITVTYAGINFKDVMARRGDAGYAPVWPFVPGLEVAGTIREIGAGVTGLEPGQDVLALTNSGGLAQVALADAEVTVPVPAGIDLATAAAVPGAFTTAMLLLDRFARLRPQDIVLVHSAGGAVCRALAAIAHLQPGVRLIGVVGADSRKPAALRAGYEVALIRSPTLAADVRDHLGGRGVDVILDPQGTAWLDQDVQALEPGGRITVFGNAAGVALGDPPPLPQLFTRNITVGGFSLAALSHTAPHFINAAMRSVLHHFEARNLTPDVTVLDGLAQAPAAQQALADGDAATKYVIHVAAG